jgi:hypothetical protein
MKERRREQQKIKEHKRRERATASYSFSSKSYKLVNATKYWFQTTAIIPHAERERREEKGTAVKNS